MPRMKKPKMVGFKFKPQRFSLPANRIPKGDVMKLVSTTTQAAIGVSVMGGALDAIAKLKK